MFGYVNILQDELKIKEYKVFKAYYCGLCKEQGKLLGSVTRLSLSYDFTVLALLLDSMSERETEITAGKCMLHPLKKRPVACSCPALSYCAYMSVALTYYKIRDDITDNMFTKSAVALPFFALPVKKVKEKYPEKVERIEEYLGNIRKYELENCKNIDLPSAEFGKLMAELFNFNGSDSRILPQMGYNLGRWLYIVDAIDDFNEDIKKKRYNPFKDINQIKDNIDSLWYNMSEIAKAYELLDIKRNRSLIDNIIYYGIKNSTLNALKRMEEQM